MTLKKIKWHFYLTVFAVLVTKSILNAQVLSPENVVDLKVASRVAIQPQGKYVAYELHFQRAEDEPIGSRYSEIWVVSVNGKEARRFTSKPVNAWAPAWTPDGKAITFLSRRKAFDKNTQVYAIPLSGGEAVKISHAPRSILSYAISPDGSSLAYRMRDAESEEIQAKKKKGFDEKVIDSWTTLTRLHIENLKTNKSHLVTSDDVNIWGFSWGPESRRLTYRASERPFTDDSYMYTQNYIISRDGGKGTLIYKSSGKLGTAAFSPDGKRIAWLGATSFNDPATGSLFVQEIGTDAPQNVMPDFHGTAVDFKWKDATTILTNMIERTETFLYELDTESLKMKKVAGGDGVIFREISLSSRSDVFATIGNTTSHPNEVYAGPHLRRLTSSNPILDKMAFGAQETISWKGRDGLEITGVLVKPTNYEPGTRYPLQVQVHGGPESAILDGWNVRYSQPVQMLAQRGFVVLMPNYRGSTGRGVAYTKGDHGDLMGEEFHDMLTGIDYLISIGLVDRNRVGIGGGSYGGYTTAWAVTKHSDRFKAGVMFAGISNQISKAGVTDTPVENAGVHWNFWLYDNMDLVWERSPIKHIRNAGTPTLIAHGERDLRVPTGQAFELYRGLKHMKVPTRLVIYPREPHGLSERSHQIDFCRRAIAWYERYLKDTNN